jgi:hypothetical protein
MIWVFILGFEYDVINFLYSAKVLCPFMEYNRE